MRDVDIVLMVDRKYADRIRSDSRARLKKLGLLAGDSYIDITPGSPKFDALEPGAMIPAARQTNVDQLISSGEDLVDNFVQISYSLKNVLGRVDRGEGLIGELTTTPETKQRITDTFLTTLNKTNAILGHIESGKGLVGKLDLRRQVRRAAHRLDLRRRAVAAGARRRRAGSFEERPGHDPRAAQRSRGEEEGLELVDNLRITSANLATFSASHAKRTGTRAAADERQGVRRSGAERVHRPAAAAQRHRRRRSIAAKGRPES